MSTCRIFQRTIGIAFLSLGVWAGVQWKLPIASRPSLKADRHLEIVQGSQAVRQNSSRGKVEWTPLAKLAAALSAIQEETDSRQRQAQLEVFANGVTVSELPILIDELAREKENELNRDLESRLLRRWAGNDPEAAAEWVKQIPTNGPRAEASEIVAVEWASQNLSKAIQWARQISEENERETALRDIAYEAARLEPVTAMGLALELPSGSERDELIRHTAAQWAATAPDAATDWGNKITDPALRERVLASVAVAWGEANPTAAAKLAAESISEGREQSDAIVAIVQRWVQKDSQAAGMWVAGFPEGPLRQIALENLIALWADQSLAQAGDWLNRVSLGADRDRAVAAYAGKAALVAPEVAARWAESIGR